MRTLPTSSSTATGLIMSTAIQPSPSAPAASGAEAQEATPNPINVPIVVRNFKASDLPLTSATRSAIEGLAHSFKKKGGYDTIRKQVWEKFASVSFSMASSAHNS